MEIERRAAPLEVRASGRRLMGIAAPFDRPARVGGVTEVITRGAFSETLADGHDILALVDHQPTHLLGRTRSGTLRLREADDGLHFEIDVPDTQLGNDVLTMAQRSDLGGMSFSFVVRPGGESLSGGRRELRSVWLGEISVMHAFAAYGADTSIAVRSRPPLDDAGKRFRLAMCRWRP